MKDQRQLSIDDLRKVINGWTKWANTIGWLIHEAFVDASSDVANWGPDFELDHAEDVDKTLILIHYNLRPDQHGFAITLSNEELAKMNCRQLTKKFKPFFKADKKKADFEFNRVSKMVLEINKRDDVIKALLKGKKVKNLEVINGSVIIR